MAIQFGDPPCLKRRLAAVSKPIPAINRYKADLREFTFLLFEQFGIDELLGQAPFDAWGADECKTTLTALPLGSRGHRAAQRARRPPGLPDREREGSSRPPASRRRGRACTRRAGSRSRADPEWGGGGSPRSLQVLVEEMITGLEHGVRDVPGALGRRGRGHRVVRDARSRRSSTTRACSTGSGPARCA